MAYITNKVTGRVVQPLQSLRTLQGEVIFRINFHQWVEQFCDKVQCLISCI